jgi:hypothetical protein
MAYDAEEPPKVTFSCWQVDGGTRSCHWSSQTRDTFRLEMPVLKRCISWVTRRALKVVNRCFNIKVEISAATVGALLARSAATSVFSGMTQEQQAEKCKPGDLGPSVTQGTTGRLVTSPAEPDEARHGHACQQQAKAQHPVTQPNQLTGRSHEFVQVSSLHRTLSSAWAVFNEHDVSGDDPTPVLRWLVATSVVLGLLFLIRLIELNAVVHRPAVPLQNCVRA